MNKPNPYSELIPCFVEDAKTLLCQAKENLKSFLESPDASSLDTAIRAVHALKGAAGLFRQQEIHLILADAEVLLEVAKSFFTSDSPRAEEISRFVLSSFDHVDALTRRLMEDDCDDNAQVLEAYQQSLSERHREYLAAFSEKADNVEKDIELQAPPCSSLVEGVDQEILDCFREEAAEIFKVLEEAFIRLREDLEDAEAAECLAKAFHKLKGAAGTVGLGRIQALAKKEQDRLEDLVDAGHSLSAEVLSEAAATLDAIRGQLGEPQQSEKASSPGDADVGPEILEVFLEEAGEYLERIGAMLAALSTAPTEDALASAAKLFHTIKGSAGIVGLTSVSQIAREANEHIESALESGAWKSVDLASYISGKLASIRTAVGLAAKPVVLPPAQPPAAEPGRTEKKAATPSPARKELVAEDLEFFAIDARENLDTITSSLLAFERAPEDRAALQAIFRSVHTIKGASSLVGLQALGATCSTVEDLLEVVLEGKARLSTAELTEILFEAVDVISALLEEGAREANGRVSDGVTRRAGRLQARLELASACVEVETSREDFFEIAGDGDGVQPVPARPEIVADRRESAVAPQRKVARTQESRRPVDQDAADHRQLIRVAAKRLDALMNIVGELIASRTRLASRIEKLSAIREELSTSKDRLLRLINDFQLKYEFKRVNLPGDHAVGFRRARHDDMMGQFSELEFDRYDDFNILSRGLIEITSDVTEVMDQLNGFFDEVEEESSYFAKVTSSMQHEVTQIRMVPASTLFRRLHRPVRDAAKHEGKEVQLITVGEDTQLDKAIIDDLFDPFVHLVRNAVSHGIEPAQERAEKSKPAGGTIILKAYQEGNNVLLEVQDDGRGIDFDAVKRKGISLGLLEADVEPSRDALLSLIFRPGFSTKLTTSEVSGRGVGLDVVLVVIRRLNGTVSVQTVESGGTKIVVRLPLTLAINQALMVESAQQTYAIPLNFVEETLLLDPREIEDVAEAEVIRLRGNILPLVRLAEVLKLEAVDGPEAGTRRDSAAVIVKLEDRRVALLVDRILSRQEIVVKTCGEFLKGLSHLSGGTIRGDGRVCFIVDVPHIVGGESSGVAGGIEQPERFGAERAEPAARRTGRDVARRQGTWVLVVDDSVSVRKVASRLLQSAGFHVDLAVDGLNALEMLRENVYDVVITDLEMPRVHGYELIQEIRRNEETKNLPIIVVTSRTGEKHITRAAELGADDYIGKPFSQEDLLSRLASVIEKRRNVVLA